MKYALAAALLALALAPSVAHAQWNTTATDPIYYDGNVGVGTGPSPAAKFIVAEGGAERFRVNADGRIVVGNGAPPNSLGVYGMTMTLNTGGFNYLRIVGGGAPYWLGGIVYDREGTATSKGFLQGFNNAGTYRIVPMGEMTQSGLTVAKDSEAGISVDSLARVGVGRLPTSELDPYVPQLTVGGASTFNYLRIVGGGSPHWIGGMILDRTGQVTSTGFLHGFDNTGRLRIAPIATMNQQGVTNAKDGVTVDQVTTHAGLTMTPDGRVSIGKLAAANATELLYVAGAVKVDGNIGAKYQDLAEWVASDEDVEPGTVVVLSHRGHDRVMASSRAYDTAVAGVVSHVPGIILGEEGAGKEQVATTGRVKVKVDATAAPIRIGDLLVTSDKPGLAMKSVPVEVGGRPMHQPGTILGKALQPLESGTGTILVLLSLQ